MPTGGDVVAAFFSAAGLVLIPIAAVNASWWFLIVGIWFVLFSTWVIWSPSRSVTMDDQGRAVFRRRKKTLVVGPGELEKISTASLLNAYRAYPLLVVARRGRIRFKPPPLGGSGELWSALAEANPEAKLVNPY